MGTDQTHFACDGCGKRYKWKPEIAGRKARCACGHQMSVPMSMQAAVPAGVVEEEMREPAPVAAPEVAQSAPAEEEDIYGMAEDDKPKKPRRAAPVDEGSEPMQEFPATMPTMPRPARSLAYATPRDDGPVLLGDADLDWVMKLRNSARLMCAALSFSFLSGFFLPNDPMIKGGAAVVIAGINLVAAWLITEKEPGTTTKYLSSRFLLRIIACVAGGGEILLALGTMTESGPLWKVGGALYLLVVPETALFLWYLRKLAIRLPSTGLAINCVIVMIGLSAVLLATAGGAYMAKLSHSPGTIILTGLGAIFGLLVFRIWYIILLIWFNRSFS